MKSEYLIDNISYYNEVYGKHLPHLKEGSVAHDAVGKSLRFIERKS
jgi:hypothetical protein